MSKLKDYKDKIKGWPEKNSTCKHREGEAISGCSISCSCYALTRDRTIKELEELPFNPAEFLDKKAIIKAMDCLGYEGLGTKLTSKEIDKIAQAIVN